MLWNPIRVVLCAAVVAAAALSLNAQDPKPEPAAEPALEKWFDNADDAVAKAKAEGKLILVKLYTDACIYCKKMDLETYPTPEAQAVLKKVVPLKINPQKNAFGQSLMQKAGARGVPANVLFDAEWNLVAVISGYKPPIEFSKAVDDALQSWADYNALKAAYAKGDMGYDDLLKYVKACRGLNRKDELLAAGATALAMKPGAHHADIAFFMAKTQEIGSDSYLEYKQIYITNDPDNATGHFDEFVIDEAIAVASKAKTPEDLKVQLPIARQILEGRLASTAPAINKEKGQIMYWVLFQMYFDKGRGDLDKALAALAKGMEMLPDSELGKHMKVTREKLSKE